MKISRVELENFRLFYGRHSVELSTDDNRSVTVFVGENGGGKTTFLNAIYWAFTGATTPRLEDPKNLINKDALREGKASAAVEITFQHNSDHKVLRREVSKTGKEHIDFWSLNPKSGIRTPEDSESGINYIRSILPLELTPWFIFDGEAVGTIELSGSTKLKEAIHKTFGFDELEAIKEHLASLQNDYLREIGSSVHDERIVELSDQIESTRKSIASDKDRIQNAIERIQSAQKIYDEKSRQLIEADKSSDIERRRRIAQDEKDRWQSQLKREAAKLTEEVRINSHNAILGNRLRKLSNTLENVSEAQDIPAPWNEILVKRILERSECICGTKLLKGSKEQETIASLLETASTQIMARRMTRLAGIAFEKAKESENFNQRTQDLRKNIESFRGGVEKQTTILQSIEKELSNVKEELVERLRAERSAAEEELDHFRELKGALTASIGRDELLVTRLQDECERLVNKSTQNQELKSQKSKVKRLLDYVSDKLRSQEDEVLKALSVELSKAVERSLTKNFKVSVEPQKYRVTVYDADGAETKLSTGERHTVTFAFVSAIIGMAASKTQFSRVDWVTQPVVAPLILDAPFSVTDSLYRANVARTFSEQVQQCVLMFDSDKWRGALEKVLKPKVKRFYIFVSRAKGPEKEGKKTLTIGEKTFQLNEYEAPREDSIIKEINIDE